MCRHITSNNNYTMFVIFFFSIVGQLETAENFRTTTEMLATTTITSIQYLQRHYQSASQSATYLVSHVSNSCSYVHSPHYLCLLHTPIIHSII